MKSKTDLFLGTCTKRLNCSEPHGAALINHHRIDGKWWRRRPIMCKPVMEHPRISQSTTPSFRNHWALSGNGVRWTPSDLSTVFLRTRWPETTSHGRTYHMWRMALEETSHARLEEWHDTPIAIWIQTFSQLFLFELDCVITWEHWSQRYIQE